MKYNAIISTIIMFNYNIIIYVMATISAITQIYATHYLSGNNIYVYDT